MDDLLEKQANKNHNSEYIKHFSPNFRLKHGNKKIILQTDIILNIL